MGGQETCGGRDGEGRDVARWSGGLQDHQGAIDQCVSLTFWIHNMQQHTHDTQRPNGSLSGGASIRQAAERQVLDIQ